MSTTYNIFISHCWRYGDQYDRLTSLLKEAERASPSFRFKDYSVPEDDPIDDASNDKQLREAIKRQMQPCSVVLILAGIYANYSKWISKEIDLAVKGFSTPKPIIAVEPWGSERTSTIVKNAAQEVVKWDTQSTLNTIRKVAR